jgi:hypothetical protein
MVSSFRLEDKLNDATNFKGVHLYMFFKLYYPAKHVCLQEMYKRPCPSSDLGFSTFIGTSTSSLAVEAPSSRFD